jgi:hypothetical protein
MIVVGVSNVSSLRKERVREEVASGNKSLLLNDCYSFT